MWVREVKKTKWIMKLIQFKTHIYIYVSTTQTSEQRYLLVVNPLRFVRLNER